MNRKMGRIVEKKNVPPPFPVGFYFFLVFNSVKISYILEIFVGIKVDFVTTEDY